ncbi:MAG: hypothetical protein KatS3mg002_0160 [Candidatus Woesearchaeota archaeon]|nr:MAG: hypothetical protein KatS3mg002_0160 [Candidatus Woesearchaeota archaeon]
MQKIKLIGIPSKQTLYITPDKIDLLIKTFLLPEYRKMIIPQTAIDEKTKKLKENLEEAIKKYETGEIDTIQVIPAKNVITTNRNYALQEMQKFDPDRIQQYKREDLEIKLGKYNIKDIITKYNKEVLKKEIMSEYHSIE